MALTKISRGLLSTGVSDSSDATAITIDSSERVMIGTTDAGYPDYGDSLTLGDVDGGGGNAGMTIRSGTSSYGTFYFSDDTGTAAGTYAGKMQYNHSNNSMVFATNSTDKVQIESDGDVDIKAGNLYLTGGNDRRIKLSDSGIAGISDSNNTVHIRGDNDGLKLMSAGNGYLLYEENGTEQLSIASGGDLKFNAGFGSSGKAYGVRAWANINQSTDAIRDSGNVSSVTDNGTGQYTINFTTSMPDSDYAFLGTANNENNGVAIDGSPPTTYSTSAVKVRIFDASNTYQELTNGILNIAVIR